MVKLKLNDDLYEVLKEIVDYHSSEVKVRDKWYKATKPKAILQLEMRFYKDILKQAPQEYLKELKKELEGGCDCVRFFRDRTLRWASKLQHCRSVLRFFIKDKRTGKPLIENHRTKIKKVMDDYRTERTRARVAKGIGYSLGDLVDIKLNEQNCR